MAIALPKSVLFTCTRNAIRSPMAALLMRQRFGRSVYVESAGLVTGDPDPFAAEVLREIGLEMKDWPQSLEELSDASFELIVALSDEAFARANAIARHAALQVEQWRIPDPSIAEGSREQRLNAYRQVRDLIAARIGERFSPGGA